MTYVYIKASTTCRYKSKPNILYKACMLFHVRGLTPVVHNWLFGPFPARPNLLYDFWMAALIQSIQTEAQWQSWIVCACAYSTFNCRENKRQRVKNLSSCKGGRQNAGRCYLRVSVCGWEREVTAVSPSGQMNGPQNLLFTSRVCLPEAQQLL